MKTDTEPQLPPELVDTALANRVKLFLVAQRGSFRELGVWADAGTVTLSGPVNSFFLRQTAIAMAKRVAGVRNVIDDLDVEREEIETLQRGEH